MCFLFLKRDDGSHIEWITPNWNSEGHVREVLFVQREMVWVPFSCPQKTLLLIPTMQCREREYYSPTGQRVCLEGPKHHPTPYWALVHSIGHIHVFSRCGWSYMLVDWIGNRVLLGDVSLSVVFKGDWEKANPLLFWRWLCVCDSFKLGLVVCP